MTLTSKQVDGHNVVTTQQGQVVGYVSFIGTHDVLERHIAHAHNTLAHPARTATFRATKEVERITSTYACLRRVLRSANRFRYVVRSPCRRPVVRFTWELDENGIRKCRCERRKHWPWAICHAPTASGKLIKVLHGLPSPSRPGFGGSAHACQRDR
jgi:hypothetical protein